MTGNGHRKPQRRHGRRLSLFIKAFLISMTIFSAVVLAGWLAYKSMIKPPEIQSFASEISDHEDKAFLPPDGEHEDMYVGDGLHAPEGFSASDRKEDFYTFLIVGMDEGYNTDTIMVASYDGINKEANIIGIPRDTMVNVKRKVKKINSAFLAGTLYGGGQEGGIDQLKREIKTVIGFTPDFYVIIDLEAFEKIIDAVDGVEINVPFDMIYDDPVQNLHINIKKGQKTLYGKDALKFARYRHGNDRKYTITDYQRIENQQQVIQALLTKLLRPSIILKVPEFINIFNENVSSNIKPENMVWFAAELNKVRGTDSLHMHTMPTTGTSGPPMYYEYLDQTALIKLINNTINPFTKDITAKDVDIISE